MKSSATWQPGRLAPAARFESGPGLESLKPTANALLQVAKIRVGQISDIAGLRMRSEIATRPTAGQSVRVRLG